MLQSFFCSASYSQSVNVPCAVLDLAAVHVLELAASGSVDDEDERRHDGKEEDGGREYGASGELANERRNDDGADDLGGGVGTSQDTEVTKGVVGPEAIRGHGDDGTVEGLETELVQHDTSNVDGNVALLALGVERVDARDLGLEGSHRGGSVGLGGRMRGR